MDKKYLVIVLILLMGCKNYIPENSIFIDMKCEPPCWENITPGQTSEDDLLKIIPAIESFIPSSFYSSDMEWGEINRMYSFDIENGWSKKLDIVIYTKNQIVQIIYISGNTGVLIDEAINMIGDPKFVLADTYPTQTILYHPSSGIVYSYDGKDQKKEIGFTISGDIQITGFAYFPPDDYKYLMDTAKAFYTSGISESGLEKWLMPWVGYGSIEELYNP